VPIKKTPLSLQNLENKEPESFLSPRSMVLKVVAGKILKTWKLGWRLTASGFFLEPPGGCCNRPVV
jgi:hypothetical protein